VLLPSHQETYSDPDLREIMSINPTDRNMIVVRTITPAQ
jgi:hypothetical protein